MFASDLLRTLIEPLSAVIFIIEWLTRVQFYEGLPVVRREVVRLSLTAVLFVPKLRRVDFAGTAF